MAATTLKTYQGDSMAAALAEVKKDLGADAVILHTRTYRVGGVMGVGAKNRVEITASADAGEVRPRRLRARPAPTSTPTAASSTASNPVQWGPQTSPAHATPATREAPREFVPIPPWRREPATATAAPPARTPADAPSAQTTQHVREPAAAPAGRNERAPEPARPAPEPAPAAAEPRVGALAGLSAGRFAPAPTTPEARVAIEEELAAIRRLVGQVLQSTRRTEVRSGQAPAEAPTGGPLFDCSMRLLDNQVATEVADRLTGAVRDALDPAELADARIVRDALLRHIAAGIRVSGHGASPSRTASGRPFVIALVGPTGVGKTTTVAKLAATYKLRHGRRIGLITADTYRIAAVEQLRTYADIVGLPLKVVLSPSDMAGAVDALADCDVVLVDTAGRSQHDRTRLDELRAFIDAARPDERHLVLSLAASESVIGAAAARFGALEPGHLILSKLDEAVEFGPIANLASRVDLPISFVTTGQEVPDHLERADAARLARLVLDGRDAWPDDRLTDQPKGR